MKRLQLRRTQPATCCWLASICLVLAFQLSQQHPQQSQVFAIQQHSIVANNEQQHNSNQAEHSAAAAAAVAAGHPMLSMGAESSSALESSAALAGDDLIAAESSPSSEAAAEHKTFTNAQVVRQDSSQPIAAAVTPVFANPQQQQQQQQQLFNMHPQHLASHLQARVPAAAHQGPQQKPFNPFMAAALAGNYGLAQQQIAAAHAASMHAQHQPHQHYQQQQQAHPQQQMQMQMHPQQIHPAHQAPGHQVHPHLVSHAPHNRAQQPQQQQVAALAEPAALAVQESSVRNNIVPAPNFNSMLDSNSIELSETPQQQAANHQHSGHNNNNNNQQQAQQQQMQPPAANQALAVASSAQHPVIAAASGVQQDLASAWPLQAPDIPKIVNLEVKCEKNLMKVSIEFDKVFNGVIFSKGHYSQGQCLHVGQNSGKQQAYFDISINSCGTQGNTQNGLYGMGGNTGSGTYFENTIVVQYDPNVQEVYDHARKLRCTWHDQYEKAVTFRPFPVDMLDIVRADFAGDNVGCWMQIQVGKGPWASEVAGIVKIGQTMTMVLAIKDEENKFDMLVRNCFAHDGKRGPIELVDKSGCITRPKLMSRFTKIKNFGSSATVLSYAHFQAFKFPDSMEVHFQCTIQICRHQCPEQCSASPNSLSGSNGGESYSESTISGTFNINGAAQAMPSADSVHLRKYGSSGSVGLNRERRDLSSDGHHQNHHNKHHHNYFNGSRFFNVQKPLTQTVGLNRVIQVVSSGDLAFAFQQQATGSNQTTNYNDGSNIEEITDSNASQLTRLDLSNQVCMSSYNFVLSIALLIIVLLCSSLVAVSLYVRQRSFAKHNNKLLVPTSHSSTCSSPVSTMRHHNVPSQQQQQQQQSIYNQHHHQQQSQLMFEATRMQRQ